MATKHTDRKRRMAIFGGAAILALVGVGTVVAQTGRQQAEITACVDGATGHLYIAASGRACGGSSLTWNQQGPAGAPGAPGPAGAAGAPGPPGPAGSSSSHGEFKVVSKTFKAPEYKGKQHKGHFWHTFVQPTSLLCPSGWTALTSGHAARLVSNAIWHVSAVATVDQPLTTASGRPFGFKIGLRIEPVGSATEPVGLTRSRWVAALSVVCMR